MKIALLQSELVWENPGANRDNFESMVKSISGEADLIVLPEMFSTGFTMYPENIAETMQGNTVLWLKSLAKAINAALTGSIVIREGENFYNRMLFVFPSGEVQSYDKKHLFSLAGEDKVYTAGKKRLVVDYKGFRICPLVCYDLRFPVFSRNTEDYDVLLYAANWPTPRIHAWDTLLHARAIENMCYTVGVNRIGTDHNGHHYPGHSQAIDFLGNAMTGLQESKNIEIVELDRKQMLETRKALGFLEDRDNFTIMA